jgi:hypothetical protein
MALIVCQRGARSYGWQETEVAVAVRVLVGWESDSVETAAGLVVRLAAERYAWRLDQVVELLLALRTPEEEEHDTELSPWDAADLSLVRLRFGSFASDARASSDGALTVIFTSGCWDAFLWYRPLPVPVSYKLHRPV